MNSEIISCKIVKVIEPSGKNYSVQSVIEYVEIMKYISATLLTNLSKKKHI